MEGKEAQGKRFSPMGGEFSLLGWLRPDRPILIDRPMTLRAKAIRYGYKESVETRVTFTK